MNSSPQNRHARGANVAGRRNSGGRLGATLWSGVGRLVCAASRADAVALAFDEGPVFPESYAYLERRGIRIDREIGRAEAAAVLRRYRDRGGLIYNR